MKNKMMILIIILVAYFILLWDCKITYTNKQYIWKIEYNGMLWVGLDYWMTWKYKSNDKPIKWINWTRLPYNS